MESAYVYLKKILAIYLAAGGTAYLLYFLFELGFGGLFISLFPATITICIFSFFIITGVLNLLSNKVKYESLIEVCLLIQALQVVLLGFSLKNYFAPYLGIGFTDTPSFQFIARFKFFEYLVANGLNKQSNEVSLTINFIPLCTLFVLNKLKAIVHAKSIKELSFHA